MSAIGYPSSDSRVSSITAHEAGRSSPDARMVARLREENEELRERVLQLEAVLYPPSQTPLQWRLTPAENRVFCLLTTREWITHEALNMVGRKAEEAEGDRLDHVLICRIRRKVRACGQCVEIKTVWGIGYRLVDRERWAKVLR